MEQEDIIADIEEQARIAGVSINQVCKRAGVHPTTFSRWKKSSRNPQPMGASLASIGKLYAALREITALENRRSRRGSARKSAAA